MAAAAEVAVLTQQQQFDVFGGLYSIFFQVLLDLLAPGEGRAFLGAHCTAHFGTPVRQRSNCGCNFDCVTVGRGAHGRLRAAARAARNRI